MLHDNVFGLQAEGCRAPRLHRQRAVLTTRPPRRCSTPPRRRRPQAKPCVRDRRTTACYREDLVRMLRAVRLAAKLGLSIDPEARKIREMAELLENVPPARLFDEMLKLLTSGHSVKCLTQLRDEGLHHGLPPLLDVIPEQPMGEKFVMLSLASTDERAAAARAPRPASVRHLLWHEVLGPLGKSQDQRRAEDPALVYGHGYRARRRAKILPSPAASPATSRKSGPCSRASNSAPASAPTPCSNSARPRGYDFLVQRAQAGELDSEIADLRDTASRMSDGEAWAEMLQPEQAGDKKKPPAPQKPANGQLQPPASE